MQCRGKEAYVRVLNEMLADRERTRSSETTQMEVYLILSIDCGMSSEQEMTVAPIHYQYRSDEPDRRNSYGLGLDLFDDPAKGEVSTFTPAFARAKQHGLGTTVHFPEIPQSSSDETLDTSFSW